MIRRAILRLVPEAIRAPLRDARALRKVRTSDWNATPPVLIYQMGKVGSRTLYEALSEGDVPFTVFHAHWLSPAGNDQMMEYFGGLGGRLPVSLRESQILRRRIESEKPDPLRIITLVRDPIRHQISGFFQGLGRWSPDCRDESGKTAGEIALEHLQERIEGLSEHPHGACRWFDTEFRPALGVDLYDHPFDTETGASVISVDGVEILVLRLEDLSRRYDAAVGGFLGLKHPPPLTRSNVTSEREYGDAYRHVLDHLEVPERVIRDVYGSRYAMHFGYDAGGSGLR